MSDFGRLALHHNNGFVVVLVAALLVGASGCADVGGKPNRFGQTVDAFRARLSQYPPDFLRLKSSTDLGYRALIVKDYEKAAWHLEFEIGNKPDDPAPRLYLGQVYAETGRTAEAQAMYRSAIALGPAVTVKRDLAAQGRPVSEIAAERLAALSEPGENGSAPMANVAEIAPGGEGKGDGIAAVPAPPPGQVLEAPEEAPETPGEVPETIVISAAFGPSGAEPAPAPAAEGEPAPTVAVHLASYKRRAKADEGWNILRRQYPELRDLEPTVIEADLGPAKGIYYRLVAGGLPSATDAHDLCRALKTKGHDWCQIGTISY